MLSVTEARAAVLSAARPPAAPAERVAVAEARGRVLAVPVTARGDVPPFPGSAMDGWAVRAGAAGRRLRIAGEARAGRPWTGRVEEGTAARISTGAALPAGAEAVVRLEDAREEHGEVVLLAAAPPRDNVRDAGEDLAAGTAVLPAGTRLGPSALAAAVAAGARELEVARRPRVTVLCTGDELREPGAPLGPGAIHNSNHPALVAQAAEAGGRPLPEGGIVPDDREPTEAALARALEHADLVVVSGGVSVGAHDHVKPALAALGVEEVFWRVALQPGKPTWFGVRAGRLVLGLPGNPVSAIVCFHLFARPALLALQGADPTPRRVTARLASAVRPNPDRLQAVRVALATDAEGTLQATPTGRQQSHLITSLLGADGLAMIEPGRGEAGEPVAVELLGGQASSM